MNENKRIIIELRLAGVSYRTIAESLGLSYDSVKAFCRRHNARPGAKRCKQCGLPIPDNYRKFCSEKCRKEWWKQHRKEELKTIYHYECEYCHKHFTLLRNMNQKYCCHDCYIKARYGEKAGEQT